MPRAFEFSGAGLAIPLRRKACGRVREVAWPARSASAGSIEQKIAQALYPPPQSCKQAHDTPPRAWYHSEVIEAVASCCLALRWQQARCVAAFPARAAARATHLKVGSEARQLRYLLRRWRLCKSAFARCPSDTWRTVARLHAHRAPTFASTQQATAAAASTGHRPSIFVSPHRICRWRTLPRGETAAKNDIYREREHIHSWRNKARPVFTRRRGPRRGRTAVKLCVGTPDRNS